MRSWDAPTGTAPTYAAGRPTAAEAALRAARASSVLDGGSLSLSENGEPDPVLAGALRVSEALEGGANALTGVWQRAPLQALAKLHALAAADLTD